MLLQVLNPLQLIWLCVVGSRLNHINQFYENFMKSLDSIYWCGIILPAASNKQPGKPGRMIFYKVIALKSKEHIRSPNVRKIVTSL